MFDVKKKRESRSTKFACFRVHKNVKNHKNRAAPFGTVRFYLSEKMLLYVVGDAVFLILSAGVSPE